MNFISKTTEELKNSANEYKAAYVSGDPFPNIYFENFFNEDALKKVLAEFPDMSKNADFNKHPCTKPGRRLKVQSCLNEGWKEEYVEQFELWNEDIKACHKSVLPVFNRMAMCSTISTFYHGNLNVIKHIAASLKGTIKLITSPILFQVLNKSKS